MLCFNHKFLSVMMKALPLSTRLTKFFLCFLRVVRRHQFIDIDEVQNHAMLPAKEAKQISYRLVGENFLQLKELKLGTSAADVGKTSMNYYFYINLNQVR
jgi:hypothetical protein